MTDTELLESKIIKFHFEVNLANTVPNVWALLTQDVNSWWMQDFRALGEESPLISRRVMASPFLGRSRHSIPG